MNQSLSCGLQSCNLSNACLQQTQPCPEYHPLIVLEEHGSQTHHRLQSKSPQARLRLFHFPLRLQLQMTKHFLAYACSQSVLRGSIFVSLSDAANTICTIAVERSIRQTTETARVFQFAVFIVLKERAGITFVTPSPVHTLAQRDLAKSLLMFSSRTFFQRTRAHAKNFL